MKKCKLGDNEYEYIQLTGKNYEEVISLLPPEKTRYDYGHLFFILENSSEALLSQGDCIVFKEDGRLEVLSNRDFDKKYETENPFAACKYQLESGNSKFLICQVELDLLLKLADEDSFKINTVGYTFKIGDKVLDYFPILFGEVVKEEETFPYSGRYYRELGINPLSLLEKMLLEEKKC